jgi:hypothetical protein
MNIDQQFSVGTGTISSYSLTIPSGAAGTEVTFFLGRNNIRNSKGDKLGVAGDTSVSFSGTAMTTEVKKATYQQSAHNGDYWIDYQTGLVTLKKADSSTSATVGYKIGVLEIN